MINTNFKILNKNSKFFINNINDSTFFSPAYGVLNKISSYGFKYVRKLRKAKYAHTTYPCIPIWEKKRFIDPFDYPLRSKKEILIDQEISPPVFPIQLELNRYLGSELTYEPIRGEKRGREAKLILNMNNMNLTSLQKKRLIFLLGPRYKNTPIFKIVYRNFDTVEKNILKAFEILRLLYNEAKRAPNFHPTKSNPKERRRLLAKYYGKTLQERNINLKIHEEKYKKEIENFEKLWAEKQEHFTLEKVQDRIINKVDLDRKAFEENEHKQMDNIEEKKLENFTISKKDYQENMFNSKKLTPKTFKLFFEKSDQAQN